MLEIIGRQGSFAPTSLLAVMERGNQQGNGPAGRIGYAVAKAGLVGLTLPAARDLAPHAIRVMTIAPGTFRTAMTGMLSGEGKDRLGSQVPFPNRPGSAEGYTQLVLSIIANPMLNGAIIRLDGAHRLR